MEGPTNTNSPVIASAPAWGTPANLAWGASATSATVPVKSLQDVMSEELAEQLEQDELQKIVSGFEVVEHRSESPVDLGPYLETGAGDRHPQDTADDEAIALMLQREFDKEYDVEVKNREKKINGTSKVSLSFNNYRLTSSREDEPEMMDSEDEEYWDEGQYVETQPTPNFRGGVSGKGDQMISKHDANIAGRRNATRAQELPDVMVGDVSSIDMKLSNNVYNKLKLHSHAEEKKAAKLHDKKEHSTAVMAMDENTRIIVYKLVNAGVLEGVDGVVSVGKEAVVLHAVTGHSGIEGVEVMPEEVALKVFKTTLTDFKNRSQYVKGDPRFFKDEFKKQNPRRIMKLWAQKEEFNLKKLQHFGIPCPKVLCLKKHVLMMSFIGKNQVAAPKLKDAIMSPVDYELAFNQVKQDMRRLYEDCMLVHADLSEYNLLWHHDVVHFIDVSQAVDIMHPHAHEFLLRDCRNMVQFFDRVGVHDVGDEYQLFNQITGLALSGKTDKEFLMQIQEYEKNEERVRSERASKDFNFDFFFNLTQKEGNSEESDEDEEEMVVSKATKKKSGKKPQL